MTHLRSPSFGRALAAAFLIATGTVWAQATWTVESLIPDLISIRTPGSTISFVLDASSYPPEAFPARYRATVPEGGVLPVQVFTNAEGTWSLLLEIADLRDDVGGTVVPASQVLYRVNMGPWLRGGGPQIIHTGTVPTVGWQEFRIEFELELTGTERAGAYVVDAAVSAIREPGF
ncbi:MAG: hypothetical protein P1P87_10695 [Trueperaceae bacterium]|nr:hypothetical protein [Trueperaceae bacterium]